MSSSVVQTCSRPYWRVKAVTGSARLRGAGSHGGTRVSPIAHRDRLRNGREVTGGSRSAFRICPRWLYERGPWLCMCYPAARRGRDTSSPSQLGHTACISLVHDGQKVHSYEQMQAVSCQVSAVRHRSHSVRISRAIAVILPPQPATIKLGQSRKGHGEGPRRARLLVRPARFTRAAVRAALPTGQTAGARLSPLPCRNPNGRSRPGPGADLRQMAPR
jgi:hypothetical protein